MKRRPADRVRFFASVQSPYCYFALERIAAIDRELAPVQLRLVAPGGLSRHASSD